MCVSGESLLKEVLMQDEYQARPINFFSNLRSFGTNKGITFTNGEHWKTQRRFFIRHLRELGFGKQKMDFMITDEVNKIINFMGQNDLHEIKTIIGTSVLSILWTLVAGERLEYSNERLQNLLTLMNRRSKVFEMAGTWLNLFPWIRFIAPKASGYELIMNINNEMKELFKSVIKEHSDTWYPDRKDDVIYAFLTEMHQSSDETFTEDQLLMLCVDVFFGGATTTSNTLDFALMCMILYPDIQKKVHESIDAAYTNCTLPHYKDRHLIPYVEAVICEVQRYYNVSPITGPRITLANTKLESYDIPKGTTVLINNYAVDHDPKLWENPDVFQPERFLDQNGNVTIPQHFNPFNIGKRKCLADALARSCIFTFFAGIMKTYTLSLADKSKPLTGIPLPGITISPEPYIPCFTHRCSKN